MKPSVTRRDLMVTRSAKAEAQVINRWGSEGADTTTYTVGCNGKTAWVSGTDNLGWGISGSIDLLVAIADAIYDVVEAMRTDREP